MTLSLGFTRWWTALRERLAGTAVAAGASSPGHGRSLWSAGELWQEPVTPSTTFYAASITKQLIAALVARAVLDGHLEVQTSIRTHLPGLPAWTTPIRVHHLLHHTATLPQPHRLAAALGYTDDAAGWSQLRRRAAGPAVS